MTVAAPQTAAAPACGQAALATVTSPLTLGVVAVEASGDLLAGSVLEGLAVGRTLDARGIGGPRMAQHGFQNWWTIDALSVRGYVEVLREYPRLRRMRNELRARMIAWRPSLFVGVDGPDFNLDLEVALRAAGLKVAHFISPSIWAWRHERIDKIRRAVDHMLLVFPFEQAIYDAEKVPATYVGHPLADVIPTQPDVVGARRALGLPESGEVVALLPGSRAAEVSHLAEPFLGAAAWLARRRPGVRFVLPAANAAIYGRLRTSLVGRRAADELPLTLIQGRSHEALAAADTVLVASGTATLETMLFGKPMVIAYKMPWISYKIMERLAYRRVIGLPNILCDAPMVPEFIQHEATPAALGAALLAQLDAPARRREIAERFAAVHEQLRRNCAQRAADVLRELADG
jgi:lipid-A-disaccharide synthase